MHRHAGQVPRFVRRRRLLNPPQVLRPMGSRRRKKSARGPRTSQRPQQVFTPAAAGRFSAPASRAGCRPGPAGRSPAARSAPAGPAWSILTTRLRSMGVAMITRSHGVALMVSSRSRMLLLAVAHGRQHGAGGGVLGEGLGDGAHRVGPRVDDLGRAEAPRRHHARAVGHLAVGQRGAVLDHQHALAADRGRVVHEDRAWPPRRSRRRG